MVVAAGTIELGISIAITLVKLGGRLDRILAGQAATRSPLALPAGATIRAPKLSELERILRQFLDRQGTGPGSDLSAADRQEIEAALSDPTRAEATLLPLAERFVADELHFKLEDPDGDVAFLLETLQDQGVTPDWSAEKRTALVYYLGPGADLREQSLPWQIGTAVAGALAEFALQNQERLVRDKGARSAISAVLTRLATPDLLKLASGRALLRHVLKATLNGFVDAREVVDGDNPWLESVLKALADARAAQDEASRDDYLLGLVQGTGYKALVAELIEEGADHIGTENAGPYRQVIADVLGEAATKVKSLPAGDGFREFFDDHWPDLARAGLKSLHTHGPLILQDQNPVLRETLVAAVGSLAEIRGRELFTADSLIAATEAAIAAVAAKPELLGEEKLGQWMKVFYGSFADVVAESGLRKAFTTDAITKIVQGAAGQVAKHPELIVENPGLPQAMVGSILKKLAAAPSFGLEHLATAAVDGALTAVAENPSLLARDDAQQATDFANVVADFAGGIAKRVREGSLSGLQGEVILGAGIAAIAANPNLFTNVQKELADLVTGRVLEAAKEDPNKLLAGTALVTLTGSVLTVVASRGRPLLDGNSAAVLADKIKTVVKQALNISAQELGRQIHLPAVPAVVGGVVDAWARGQLESLDPDDPAFKDLFAQLAGRATQLAA